MAVINPTILPKNTWVKVLTSVTTLGQVIIVEQEIDPTRYECAIVNPAGDPAPDENYSGGFTFTKSIAPASTELIDIYVKAVNHDGKVIVIE